MAKYRELDKEKPLWDQMDIADNEYANKPDIKAVIEKMIADDGDVMRPPADGKLRRTNNPDGTPLNIDLHLKDPTPIVAPTYRLNPTTAKCVTDNLEDMEAMGMVRRTEYSPWISLRFLCASQMVLGEAVLTFVSSTRSFGASLTRS